MKNIDKTLLLAAAAASACLAANADTVAFHSPESCQVLSVSPNGRWACGIYIDAMMNTYPFRWDLESAEIEMLSSETGTAWDVSNDGTVSGEYTDHSLNSTGAGVEVPGYWRDGVWHTVEVPEGSSPAGGIGYGISPDGQYMGGAIEVDGVYKAFIWKNGQIHRQLESDNHAVATAVAPDGSGATGFYTRYNRTACYWAPDGSIKFFDDSDVPESPWCYGRNFSPDGTKILYWGGWQQTEDQIYLYAEYDIATGERMKVPSTSISSDLEFFDISNTGLMVGADQQRGYIWTGSEGMVIDDYLSSRGVDLSDFDDFYGGTDYYVGQLPIHKVVAVNEDNTVFAMLYYNTRGQNCSMIVKVDVDLSKVAPAKVRASQLSGLQTVGINWVRPVGATSIRGYNVYRNGQKINGFLPITNTYYYDRNLAPGTYQYQIAAVNLSGAETRAETVTVEVETPDLTQSPRSPFSRQKGANSAYLNWLAPMSNCVHKRYYEEDINNMLGFSVYEPVEIEMAIRYDKAHMESYAGYKVAEVSFLPMSPHSGWCVRLYTYDSNGELRLISSQPVTEPLQYGQFNTVRLQTPAELPDGDLVVAIAVTGDPSNQETLGGDPNRVTVGYSDLLRQVSEPDFYSAFDRSAASGMSLSCVSWAIDLGLEATDHTAVPLTHYNIYTDGQLTGDTDANTYVIDHLDDGTYTMAVEAVYADESVSPRVETTLQIKGNYPSISSVDIQPSTTGVKLEWEAPVDVDLTKVSYVSALRHSDGIKGVESNGYALMVGAEYPASMLRGYEGYTVKSFRFYPMAEALYTILLYENNRIVYELEVDDYTTGTWNEIALPDEVLIKANTTYFLAVDCFDPEPDVKVMGIDNTTPIAYRSELYSIDNGETWNSLSIDTGAHGNWMLGMNITAPEAMDLDIEGYNVVIDNAQRNTETITATSYECDLGANDSRRHSLRVDVVYGGLDEAKRGTAKYFYLESGISDVTVSEIRLHKGDNYLVAEGADAESITVTATDGKTVASAAGNKVEISHLATGVYVVTVQTAGKTEVHKISIN